MSIICMKSIFMCIVALNYTCTIEVGALLLKDRDSEQIDSAECVTESPAIDVEVCDFNSFCAGEEGTKDSSPLSAIKKSIQQSRPIAAINKNIELRKASQVASRLQELNEQAIEQHASDIVDILKRTSDFSQFLDGGIVTEAEFYDRDESRKTYFLNPEHIRARNNDRRVVEAPSLFVMIKNYIKHETDFPMGLAGTWGSLFDMNFRDTWGELYIEAERLFNDENLMEKTYSQMKKNHNQKAWFDLVSYVFLSIASNAQTRSLDIAAQAGNLPAVGHFGYITHEASTTYSKAQLKAMGILPTDEDLIDVGVKVKELSFKHLMSLCTGIFSDRGNTMEYSRGQLRLVGPSAWEEKVVREIETTINRSAVLDESCEMQHLMMQDLGITTSPEKQQYSAAGRSDFILNRELVFLPEAAIRWIRAEIDSEKAKSEDLSKFPRDPVTLGGTANLSAEALLLKKKQQIVLEMAKRLQAVGDVVDRLLNDDGDNKEQLFECATSKQLTHQKLSKFAVEVQAMDIEEVKSFALVLQTKLALMSKLRENELEEDYDTVKSETCELIKEISSGDRATNVSEAKRMFRRRQAEQQELPKKRLSALATMSNRMTDMKTAFARKMPNIERFNLRGRLSRSPSPTSVSEQAATTGAEEKA